MPGFPGRAEQGRAPGAAVFGPLCPTTRAARHRLAVLPALSGTGAEPWVSPVLGGTPCPLPPWVPPVPSPVGPPCPLPCSHGYPLSPWVPPVPCPAPAAAPLKGSRSVWGAAAFGKEREQQKQTKKFNKNPYRPILQRTKPSETMLKGEKRK